MKRRWLIPILTTAVSIGFANAPAMGVVIGGIEYLSIQPLKLIVVDKLASSSSAKVVYVAKDDGITKGSGTDPTTIRSSLKVYYGIGWPAVFENFGNWVLNNDTVAKYVNESAPTGGATKVSVIKPGKLLKNVAKSLGDDPIDISSPPVYNVLADYLIRNGDERIHLCGAFLSSACTHKGIAGGTGWKLVCKSGFAANCPTNPCTTCGAFID